MDWQEKMANANESSNDVLNDLVEEIISEPKFDPFNPKNIIEAIYDDCLFRNNDQFRIAELMEKREIHNLGRFIYGRIIDYWERRATEEAENRLSNSWGEEK